MICRSTITLFAIALCTSLAAHAQKPPQIKEMKPGKYSYTIETNNPGLPFKMPPVSFSHCVAAKDIEEGKALQSQRDAGVDCTYSDIKASANRYQFKSSCTTKQGMVMKGDYDMKVVDANTFVMDFSSEMTGKDIPPAMAKSTNKMTMKRTGDC